MSHRIRILHLRTSNFVGGPERQLLQSGENEREGPLELIFGTLVGETEGHDFARAVQVRGLQLLPLPAGTIGDIGALSRLVRYIREHSIALLCTHGYQADILGTLAGLRCRIPVAWFLRGWTGEDWKVRIYEKLDRTLLHLATRIVCLSNTQADQLACRRGLARKIRVVSNVVGVPAISDERRLELRDTLRRRLGLPNESVIVATAGRLSPEKGAAYFLQAIPMIAKWFPMARFVVFGSGPLKTQLKVRAQKLSLGMSVCFAGFVPDFAELLPGIDLLVNPSLSEVMPNVVLESMAAGIPVVATDVGGVAEIAGPDEAIIVIPPKDSPAIARAVLDLLHDPDRIAKLGRAGQMQVRAAYSPASQKAQLRALYQEMVPGLAGEVGAPEPLAAATRAPQTAPQNTLMTSPNPNIIPPGRTQAPSASREPGAALFVSVVIPVRNEEAHLGAVLDDLTSQDYPHDHYEILVVDGQSTDRTTEIINQYASLSSPPVRLFSNPGSLSSSGRNVGVRHSRGELVLFVDGHCRIPNRSLLSDSVRIMQETGALCLCRPQPLTLPGNTWFQDTVAYARATLIGHGRDSTIYATEVEGFINPTSSGAAYRRSVFERVGLYDERFDACEDVEFNHRVYQAGIPSYLSPRLTVAYQPRSSLSGLFRQMLRYGRGRFRLMQKHKEAASLSQLVPAAFVAGLMLLGAGSLASNLGRLLLWIVLLAYAALLLGFSAGLGVHRGWRSFLLAPFIYMTIHFGFGVGYWAGAFQAFREKLRPGRVSSRASAAPRKGFAGPTRCEKTVH
jgi:glycosyltransferase involved in cell wall biosynthesis